MQPVLFGVGLRDAPLQFRIGSMATSQSDPTLHPSLYSQIPSENQSDTVPSPWLRIADSTTATPTTVAAPTARMSKPDNPTDRRYRPQVKWRKQTLITQG